MPNRIPLVIDTDNQNKISELPTGDNLDLSNSQIIGVSSLSTGSLVINSVPFSGSYNDLTNKPTIATDVASLTDTTNRIPTLLTQLNISDGTVGQVLTTDGAGNFTFSTLAQSGGDTIVVQGGDITGIQIAGDDSVALTVAGNNTLKFEGAGTITTTAAEVSGTTVLTITGSDNNTTYSVQTADGVAGDSKRLQLVSNTAVTDNITFKEGANVTITRDPASDTLEFAAANTVNSYTISSETNGATQTTLRLSESGGAIDEVAFVGGTDIDVVRTDAGTITINSTFTETPQFVLQTVNSDGGSYVAQSAVDEFSIIGGTGITTSSSGSNVTVAFNGTNIASMGFTSGVSITEFSSDATLAGNSNSAVPTEQAVKTYVDGEIAGVGGGGGGGNAFGNIVVQGEDTVGADQATDNLEFIPSNNIGITTNATNDSVTFAFTPAGGNTQLQWNNNGVLGASSNMTWNDGSNTLSVTNIVATSIEANTIQAPSSLVGTYTISSPTTITLDPTSEVQLDAPIKLQSKTTAQLASFVASAGSMVAVSDNSYKPAYYNGSVWKYVGDDSNV